MARRRTKSSDDIWNQWARIYVGSLGNPQRRIRASKILKKYTANIAKSLGRRDMGQATEEENTRQIARSTYMGLSNG